MSAACHTDLRGVCGGLLGLAPGARLRHPAAASASASWRSLTSGARYAVLVLALSVIAGLLPGGREAHAQVVPPAVGAHGYLLLDVSADQELAAREPEASLPPASLTKLMTAYLVFDALRIGKLSIDEALPVSAAARAQTGSRMFLDAGMRVPVDDLLKGLLVQSGNDAAVALAEGMAGSVDRFVQLMNEQALGLRATHFANPTGLPAPGQQSTARDLARLSQRLLRDFPERAAYFAMRKYRYPGTPPANDGNRNVLLFRDPSVDGLKTGHTDAAGYCIIATAQRAVPGLGPDGQAGPRRLLVVLLGADSENSRANEAQQLLNWGYSAFDTVRLFDADQAVATPTVWKGNAARARLGWSQPLLVSLPRGQARQLRTEVVRPEPLIAPLRRGQAVGSLKVYNGERLLLEKPLNSLDDIDRAGMFGRAWDAFRLWIQ